MKCGWRYGGLILRNVRDLEVIDSEFRRLVAIRRAVREAEGQRPSTARIDALLDERSQCARATLSNMAFNVIRP